MAGQACWVQLATGRQNAQGHRQVEAARIFRQIGRCQVDGDALVIGELETRVLNGAAHPLARLLHLDIGQADQREAGQPIGQMHLDRDGRGFQAQQGPTLHQSKTHRCSSPKQCNGDP